RSSCPNGALDSQILGHDNVAAGVNRHPGVAEIGPRQNREGESPEDRRVVLRSNQLNVRPVECQYLTRRTPVELTQRDAARLAGAPEDRLAALYVESTGRARRADADIAFSRRCQYYFA